MTRSEHLAWCKKRALDYINQNDARQAWASFTSDMGKHDETAEHVALGLGHQLFLFGHLSSPRAMRDFIEGFN